MYYSNSADHLYNRRLLHFTAGDDADLCSELLQESLDALRALPEATLFDEGNVSSVWLEVVERATKFLRFVFTDHLLTLYLTNNKG